MNKPIVVITTTGSEPQALTIAEELIQRGLAASINLIPNMRTIYRFNGKIFDDDESMLVIKTVSSHFKELSSVIRQLHTYEIPEIFSLSANQWDEAFYAWLKCNTEINLENKINPAVEKSTQE